MRSKLICDVAGVQLESPARALLLSLQTLTSQKRPQSSGSSSPEAASSPVLTLFIIVGQKPNLWRMCHGPRICRVLKIKSPRTDGPCELPSPFSRTNLWDLEDSPRSWFAQIYLVFHFLIQLDLGYWVSRESYYHITENFSAGCSFTLWAQFYCGIVNLGERINEKFTSMWTVLDSPWFF